MKKILIILLFCLSAAPAFAGNVYYVDATSGNNSNTGLSDAQAWADFTNVTSLATGSDVYLKCGETWSQKKLRVNWTGTSGDRVVIGAYYMDGSETVGVNGDGRPIIDGEDAYPTVDTNGLLETAGGATHVHAADSDMFNPSLRLYPGNVVTRLRRQ